MKENSVKITFLYCSNSLSSLESSQCVSEINDIELNMIGLPCSGKVNIQYLLKAIETDSDGLILATCKLGECKFIQGNIRAQKRAEVVDELLSETGIGKGRIKHIQISTENKIENIVKQIKELGSLISVPIYHFS